MTQPGEKENCSETEFFDLQNSFTKLIVIEEYYTRHIILKTCFEKIYCRWERLYYHYCKQSESISECDFCSPVQQVLNETWVELFIQ